jgi:molybdenum cofactor cytidylyltransferase
MSYTAGMSTLKSDPVAIVLAAGSGRRMGADKMLAVLGGRRVIEHTLRAYRKAQRVQDVVLVIPPGATSVYEPLRTPRIHLVENPDPSRGMISSIRTGLECGWAHQRNFLVAPGDVPFVKPDLVDRIVSEFITRDCKIVIPTYKGLGGHPGLFSQDLRKDFFLRGDTNGPREILFRYARETVRINVHDPDVCFDVDTVEDLQIALDPGARWAKVEDRAEEKRKGLMG